MIWRDGSAPETGAEALIERWRAEPDTYLWVDLDHDSADAAAVLGTFGADEAVIEQSLAVRYPPKIEALSDDVVFILLRGLDAVSRSIDFGTIQIAFLVGPRFLISRHSARSPSIERVQELLQTGSDQVGRRPAELALDVAEVAVGRYVPIVLNLEGRLETIEDEMFENPTDDLLNELLGYKRQLKKLRRIASYHVSLFERVRRDSHPLFRGRDRQASEIIEQFERIVSLSNLHNDLANDLMNGYLSLSSHRLNHIMKVLTVITCIFVPITFIAGIYGMNFDYMPELNTRYAYFGVLGFMAVVVVSLLILFRRKQWF
ncbi:MAG: magnesium transporter CorA family protein [Pseudomonadales bacterium]|jgi:magnesium transporter